MGVLVNECSILFEHEFADVWQRPLWMKNFKLKLVFIIWWEEMSIFKDQNVNYSYKDVLTKWNHPRIFYLKYHRGLDFASWLPGFQVKTCRLISQCLNRIFEKFTLSYRKIPRVNRPDLYFLERFMRALTNALLIKTENLFWTKRE